VAGLELVGLAHVDEDGAVPVPGVRRGPHLGGVDLVDAALDLPDDLGSGGHGGS
jgi:hypothetical protein